ncbi:MAG: winged helix-turn-helix transcriptional regulator [Clostridia bacterium]|nr:winged helix-turn-helix transcriptional regulator [Clostridia bacterium]
MKPIIHNKPEWLCETIALLYISRQRDEMVELMINLIGEREWDVREFTTRHEQLHKKYTNAFNKNRVSSEHDEFFFEEIPLVDYLVLTVMYLNNRDWVYDIDSTDVDEIRNAMKESYRFITDSMSNGSACCELEEYLDSSDGLNAIYNNPKEYLSAFSEIIRNNVPAMENAWDEVRTEAQGFVALSWNNSDEFYKKSNIDMKAPIKHVYPQLSIYTNAFIINETYYYGLFNADIRPEEERLDEKERIVETCKAIGDATRAEILLLLSERPWYNRELAAKLNLTPATVMHHIDVLLACGIAKMTTCDDNQKRIYYTIDSNHAKWLTTALDRMFSKQV